MSAQHVLWPQKAGRRASSSPCRASSSAASSAGSNGASGGAGADVDGGSEPTRGLWARWVA
eukprot:scaffold98758_cov14-Prasinocladus_malaysianus.AAC.1